MIHRVTLQPDSMFGPYRIQSRIGAGGMGEVYLAKDTRLGRIVALKVLPPNLSDNEQMRQRLTRERKQYPAYPILTSAPCSILETKMKPEHCVIELCVAGCAPC
jgi:serine/threonine protein kinase